MKIEHLFLAAGLLLAIAFTLSCSGENGKDGFSCSVEAREKTADGFDVICDGEKVGELASGKDGKSKECLADRRADSVLVICNDEKVAVFYDGKKGKDGDDGKSGELGEQGAAGEDCSIADDAGNSAYLKIICGSGENKTEKTLAKAICGTTAYDPANMFCEKDRLTFDFTDARDGKKYKAVTIGEQIWMAENLNYNVNGLCYNNNASNCDTYGRLYDWATAMGLDALYNYTTYTDEKKKDICPADWHLPSDEEWLTLINFIGGADAAPKLKATSGWANEYYRDSVNVAGSYRSFNRFIENTDDYGFSALPGGYYQIYIGNEWVYIGERGHWWTTTSPSPQDAGNVNADLHAVYVLINLNNITIDPIGGLGTSISRNKVSFKSVRCVKDEVQL